MWKYRQCAEGKRNNRYRGQEPKKLHGKAKGTITAQGCASLGVRPRYIHKINQTHKLRLIGNGRTKKKANGHMGQTVGELN